MVVSQALPSAVLRMYCAVARWSARTFIASTVPAGSSEGLVMTLPVVRRSCSWPMRLRLSCRWASDARCSPIWVTRPILTSPSDPAGAVDQGIEHLIDGGHHPSGGLVGALVHDEVHPFLVEVHGRLGQQLGPAVGLAA